MDKKIQVSTLSEQIVEKLKLEIISGKLKEGERILEQQLATEFGVSRIPVREALKTLASENFITIQPFKGAIVKDVQMPDVEETLNIHLALLDLIRDKVKNKLTIADFEKADKILDAVEANTDFRNFKRLTWDFAEVMYAPSGLSHTIDILKEIYQMFSRATVLLKKFTSEAAYPHTTNREFLNLCKEGHYDEAFAVRKQHIIKVREEYMTIVNKLHSENVRITA
ncbi:GntR family transcriptional regulator [Solitalea koreensis]|uniref:DNA-binding transcriptional regulator, GntR family n=1 Tax=Solitalea koreensis TaxID=543615 RepID=A0A521D0D6_9SPHI|nr:GntR family transcriptional regulator [Solitalea koreensis]SMO64350.1 DNA-binding transcriptional regulator, GntR family [Solitalea koreensis]